MQQVSIKIFLCIFGNDFVVLASFDFLICYIFSLEIREPLDTNNSYRASKDLLRRWRTVGRSRRKKFKKQKRKKRLEEKKKEKEERKRDKEVDDWLTGQHRNIRTDIFYGRNLQNSNYNQFKIHS